MDDYLAKPLRPEELDAVLERWLGVPLPEPPAAAPPSAGEALIDDARMRTFRAEYPEIVDQLVDLFAAGTPPVIAELRAAIDAGDGDGVRRSAHKLKGSCQNIGATFMATLCRTLETGEADLAEDGRRPRVRPRPDRGRDPPRADGGGGVILFLGRDERELGERTTQLSELSRLTWAVLGR